MCVTSLAQKCIRDTHLRPTNTILTTAIIRDRYERYMNRLHNSITCVFLNNTMPRLYVNITPRHLVKHIVQLSRIVLAAYRQTHNDGEKA